jgi:hypothetical protein
VSSGTLRLPPYVWGYRRIQQVKKLGFSKWSA